MFDSDTSVSDGDGGGLLLPTHVEFDGVGTDSELNSETFAQMLQDKDLEKNLTSVNDVIDAITDPNFATFLLSLIVGITWIVYITFYSSRVTGLLVTKLVNHFFKDGHIKIGMKNCLNIFNFLAEPKKIFLKSTR